MISSTYWVPYMLANTFALVVLALAFWRRDAARWAGAGVFAWAAVINTWTAATDPGVYLNYAALTPSETYREFILGWFSQRIPLVVILIAAGQLMIAALMASRDEEWRRIGVIGAEVFLLAVAPLGIGAGFPFSLTFGAALVASVGWGAHVSRALQTTIHWAPRVAGGGLACLLVALAGDAWGDGTTVLQRIAATLVHLIPAALVVGTLAIARRSPRAAGVLCFVLAVAYAVFAQGRINWILVVATPLVVEGALFLLSDRLEADARHA